MMSIRTLVITVLLGALFIAVAWAPSLFIESKIGPAGPCEVSNSCGLHR